MINLEAEQSILGSILLEENLDNLELKPQHFAVEIHKLIFSSMLKIASDKKPIDTITLIEELRKSQLLEAVGGINYITKLITVVPSTANVLYYINIIKSLAIKRKLAEELKSILLDIEQIGTTELTTKMDNLKEIVEDTQSYQEMFCDFSQVKSAKEPKTISTGFQKLDRATHGLEEGTLSILTGEPGTGKSTLLNQIIANAISENINTFLYSGELKQQNLKAWFYRTVANGDSLREFIDEFGSKKFKTDSQTNKKIDKWVENKLFIFNDNQKPSELNLIGTIKYLAKHKNVKLIVLDNLMTMIAESPSDNEYQKQKYLVNNLKNIAKQLNLVIILVSHVTKESQKNDTPSMFDVLGASEIVNLSDYVFKLTRSEKYTNLHILKNRIQGIQGVYLKLFFDDYRKRFYTIDGDERNKNFLLIQK